MARSYRIGKRGELAERSRKRVVEATRQLLCKQGYHGFSVETVADAAGVSRATVYNQFESKRGILESVFDDIGRRIEYHRVHDALAAPDPRQATRQLLAASCLAWARDQQVIGRVVGLVAADPDLAALVQKHELGRQAPIHLLVERLRRRSALRRDVSAAEASSVLSVLTSFTTYEQLANTGLDPGALLAVLERLASAVVAFGRSSETRPKPAT
jgi:AcrR family transcriptional regulator